jgi:hypothetical protein
MSEHFQRATALLSGEPQASARAGEVHAGGTEPKKKVVAPVERPSPAPASTVIAAPAAPRAPAPAAPNAPAPAAPRATTPAAPHASPARKQEADAIRQHPMVREIAEILDATVSGVSLRGDIGVVREATSAGSEGESAP